MTILEKECEKMYISNPQNHGERWAMWGCRYTSKVYSYMFLGIAALSGLMLLYFYYSLGEWSISSIALGLNVLTGLFGATLTYTRRHFCQIITRQKNYIADLEQKMETPNQQVADENTTNS